MVMGSYRSFSGVKVILSELNAIHFGILHISVEHRPYCNLTETSCDPGKCTEIQLSFTTLL